MSGPPAPPRTPRRLEPAPSLAPRRADPAPPRTPARVAVPMLVGALATATGFYAPLLLGGSLGGHDWSSHHFHYFDWVRIGLVEHGTLPLYMADAWITPNFLANAESPVLSPLAWLLVLLPTDACLKLLLVLYTATGIVGMLALLRDCGVELPAAAPYAVLFAANGFFVSHLSVGHAWAMGGLVLPLLLFLYRRAALGSDAALAGGALLGAASVLAGQHQPFIWQNLLLAMFALLWALRVRSAFPVWRFAALGLLTTGLAAVKLVPMVLEFADYAPTARIPGLPAELLASALLSRGQGPEWVREGLAYLHGAGWWEYACYVGPLGLLLLGIGIVASRGGLPLALPGLLFLALSLSGPGGDVGAAWQGLQDLPLWRTQRAPSRFLFPALFAFGVLAATGLGRLYRSGRERWPRLAPALAAATTLLLALDLFVESLPWQRAAVGEPLASRDHRPRPLVWRTREAVGLQLVDFAPNRLVYRSEASGPAQVVLPLRFREGVDAWDAGALAVRESDGRLALDVPEGTHEIALSYRPQGLALGAAASAGTVALLAAAALARRRGRGREAG